MAKVLRFHGHQPRDIAKARPGEGALARDEALSDFKSPMQEPAARTMSEVTGGPQGATPGEDEDGLDAVARALRDAAEGPLGRRLGK